MKPLRKLLRLDLGLALLVLVVGIMTFLPTLLSTAPAADRQSPDTHSPDLKPEITPLPYATRTPLPKGSVYVGAAQEVQLSIQKYLTATLRPFIQSVDGNLLVSYADVADGVILAAIDLRTGQAEQLAFWPSGSPQFGMDAHVSGNHIAWQERVARTVTRLHVYDIKLKREVLTLDSNYLKQLDLKDDLLVWPHVESKPDNSGILYSLKAYDLQAQREFVIIAASETQIGQAYLCSPDWVIYLYDMQYGGSQDGTAELRAHNLQTGEDFSLSPMFLSEEQGSRQQHACDGNWITWLAATPKPSEAKVYDQYLYDLKTRRAKLLDIPTPLFPMSLRLAGNVLFNGEVGYDLATGTVFSPPSVDRDLIRVTEDRLVWTASPRDGFPLQPNIAPIVRSSAP